jgi:hypothetical protein
MPNLQGANMLSTSAPYKFALTHAFDNGVWTPTTANPSFTVECMNILNPRNLLATSTF